MSLPSPISLTIPEARRFHQRAVLLDAPAPDVATALSHHGFIQIDPINVCGRIQDLILRNRVTGYREGDLFRHVYGASKELPLPAESRTAFEQHLPHTNILTVLPVESWPYLLAAMERRSDGEGAWSGKLDAR
ncbi:MAG TPA: winged helix-turn-helix domain-containing protein, partial [Verrucomicrobium sp.]|nr:winged helix-turn-helix domain-containing protein [Verrucomicrobium sp.]